MKKVIALYLLSFLVIGSGYAQRQVVPGKTLGSNNKNPAFDHMEGVFIPVNGINMYYEEYGEGPALLLIHENGGSVESFNGQINFFSKKYKVIVADSRGQGNTNNAADSITYELMTDDYFALMEKLELDSAYVVGIDDGAIIGLMLAVQYPEKVKMLAVYSARLNADSSSVVAASTDLTKFYKQMYADSIKAGKNQFKDALQLTNLTLHHPQIEPELLLNITAPVLVMGGDRDIVQLEHTVFIYRQLPRAQLTIFPGATHYLVNETPMIINNAISRFFSKPFYDPDVEETIKFK